jgi:hypothetical protein
MSQTANTAIAVIDIDIGKNSFHVVGHDARGAIVLRQKWSARHPYLINLHLSAGANGKAVQGDTR